MKNAGKILLIVAGSLLLLITLFYLHCISDPCQCGGKCGDKPKPPTGGTSGAGFSSTGFSSGPIGPASGSGGPQPGGNNTIDPIDNTAGSVPPSDLPQDLTVMNPLPPPALQYKEIQ